MRLPSRAFLRNLPVMSIRSLLLAAVALAATPSLAEAAPRDFRCGTPDLLPTLRDVEVAPRLAEGATALGGRTLPGGRARFVVERTPWRARVRGGNRLRQGYGSSPKLYARVVAYTQVFPQILKLDSYNIKLAKVADILVLTSP